MTKRAADMWQYVPAGLDNPEGIPYALDLAAWLADRRRCTDARHLLEWAGRVQSIMQNPPGNEIARWEQLYDTCPG